MRKRAVARGRVQGVFFRDSVRERAEAAGVAGWITNRADGTVEAVLEGDAGPVERVLDWMREGPPRADVERIDVTEEEPEGLNGFEVR
ncbi:MAG TPA: acylphosphatase [Thermoleophilaceae bacterium]|nr:acylphosphatase [Thermoleophilaceae bacterium]